MTAEQLISEGRALQRPCVFLRPQGAGPNVAVWHEPDEDQIESTGHRCWLTIDSSQIPGIHASVSGYLNVFTDEEECRSGRVEVTPSWSKPPGTKLYAFRESVLPPIDAVFARGSDAVGEWLQKHDWPREER